MNALTAKQRDIAEIRSLGIEIVIGDLVKGSIDELASVFAQYDTVISCAGYAAGIDTRVHWRLCDHRAYLFLVRLADRCALDRDIYFGTAPICWSNANRSGWPNSSTSCPLERR